LIQIKAVTRLPPKVAHGTTDFLEAYRPRYYSPKTGSVRPSSVRIAAIIMSCRNMVTLVASGSGLAARVRLTFAAGLELLQPSLAVLGQDR
jgi:hypothetical protein